MDIEIRKVKKMERLKELLDMKEELEMNDTLSDEVYYMMMERIDNEIANYSIEEIEKAEKER